MINAGDEMVIGGKYNWIGQEERLVYLGYNFSVDGYCQQFAKVDSPTEVWCECQFSDIEDGMEISI